MEKMSGVKLTHPQRPKSKRWGKIAKFVEENTGLTDLRVFLEKYSREILQTRY
jgi:hypothetical protein